jgi:hypothetical protein
MVVMLQILYESFMQATGELLTNKLRTFLSLLGRYDWYFLCYRSVVDDR